MEKVEKVIPDETKEVDDSIELIQYNALTCLEDSDKQSFLAHSSTSADNIKKISLYKSIKFVKKIPIKAKLHYTSIEYAKLRSKHKDRHHPVKPLRGEIYDALITENIGSELCGNHPVVVMSNPKTNIFADKINVLPIEGDGNKVPPYLERLTNKDLENGHLRKDPSRVIIPEVITIDKSRLGRKIGLVKPEKMVAISKKLKRQLLL